MNYEEPSSYDLYDIMMTIHEISTYEEGLPVELLNEVSDLACKALDHYHLTTEGEGT